MALEKLRTTFIFTPVSFSTGLIHKHAFGNIRHNVFIDIESTDRFPHKNFWTSVYVRLSILAISS